MFVMMNGKPFKIFVDEDNEWYNRLFVHTLERNPDYEIEAYTTGMECLNNLSRKPDVITLDYRLPDINGMEVLKKVKEQDEDIQVVMISEQDEIQVVVDLFRNGAYDYIVKSNNLKERLFNTVNNIYKDACLKKELKALRGEVKKKYSFQKTIIGNSSSTQKIYDLIDKATRTNITIAITGETGTGKELVAKAIHYNSNRANQPFVAVNVAAIPETLIESELFGHEKGAFTGAITRRIGKFEEAMNGTLFLDEIAEMDVTFQAKLLRTLQEKEIVRIGSNTPVKINCRIITATNVNLLEASREEKFRKDLYYRLMGLPIELPPLRERGNDILLLAKHFIDEFCEENDLTKKSLDAKASNKLMAYSFPGNVRELRSIIELAVTLTDGDTISSEQVMLDQGDLLSTILSEELTLREYEKKIVFGFLDKYDQNTKLVAEKLGIGVATIYRMIKEDQKNCSKKG